MQSKGNTTSLLFRPMYRDLSQQQKRITQTGFHSRISYRQWIFGSDSFDVSLPLAHHTYFKKSQRKKTPVLLAGELRPHPDIDSSARVNWSRAPAPGWGRLEESGGEARR